MYKFLNLTIIALIISTFLYNCGAEESYDAAESTASPKSLSEVSPVREKPELSSIREESRKEYDKRDSGGVKDSEKSYKPTVKKNKKVVSSLSGETKSRRSSEINRRPKASGLRAGFVDDNKQFNYFLNFLEKHHQEHSYKFHIEERIRFKAKDKSGKSIANCKVKIYDNDDDLLEEGKTMADGSYLFYPSEFESADSFNAKFEHQGKSDSVSFERFDRREIVMNLDYNRGNYQSAPLDIAFVMDTTGSMGEEIARLKSTIDLIHLNISNFSSKPDVRFAMVLYRDVRDSYRTKVIPFTSDLDEFKEQLDKVNAAGGGDEPEDLQEALKNTMQDLEWRDEGIRLSFIITDASPHLDYDQDYTYYSASKEAKRRAIKLFTIGTGGLMINGEYILRQISQYTSANFIFLHYGESGESEGGRVGAVSHHTGANYQVSTLEGLIIRLTKEELSHLTNQPIYDEDEYFVAQKTDEDKEFIIKQLFFKAVGQLIDYSTIRLKKSTPVSVVPLTAKSPRLKADAEYLTQMLSLAVSRKDSFKLIERADIQKILQEQHFQGSALFDEKKSVKLGQLIGADALIFGEIHERGNYLELLIKMARVRTGEILSITKIKIDQKLRS